MSLSRRAVITAVPVAAASLALPLPSAVADPVPRLRFPLLGSSVNGPLSGLGVAPQIDVTRVYLRNLPTGSAWGNVNGSNDLRVGLARLAPGGTLWLSYKEADIEKASAFFSTMPSSVLDHARVMCTYHHEPEDNFTTAISQASYRARWREHAAMMRQHGMHPTSCLMRYTLQRPSGRDWRTWYPGDEYVDFTGWDVYRKGPAGENGPETIAKMVAPIEQVAAETGTRWAIGETGSTRARYSQADTASWARNWRDHVLAAPDSSVACWWDQDLFTFTPQVAAVWLGL